MRRKTVEWVTPSTAQRRKATLSEPRPKPTCAIGAMILGQPSIISNPPTITRDTTHHAGWAKP